MELSLLSGGSKSTLETVRLLHDTILALRTALEGSQKELLELKSQNKFLPNNKIENSSKNEVRSFEIARKLIFLKSMDNQVEEEEKSDDAFEIGAQEKNKTDSGAESDDIDDIELVFTTKETDPTSINEDLVPIEGNLRNAVTNTVVVETDISKCGVIEEHEMALSTRRNTLPNPVPYQPIIHREILAKRNAPIRSPYKAIQPGMQDMGAQTDITALPNQWKSETYLAHKMNYNLTTLPSKFTLPMPQTKRLPLSNKTREARRVLLSDINFTSMVPELSRSADHLHDDATGSKNSINPFCYAKSPKTEKCFDYTRQESRSSCGSCYGSRCHTSSTSIAQVACEEARRKYFSKPPHLLCCKAEHIWSSVPSPSFGCIHAEDSVENYCNANMRRRRSKIHFYHCEPCRQSMPNLRLNFESGESTDSLVDETEEFLRRSIDNILLSRSQRKNKERRSSDTDSISSFEPSIAAQPFLPKIPEDLKCDCLVKVITPEGRVAVGRVRFSGNIPGLPEPYVGVELSSNTGFSNGFFMGHHLFDCDPDHALFVPFKKVVIAWSV